MNFLKRIILVLGMGLPLSGYPDDLPVPDAKPEKITSLEQAINLALAHNREILSASLSVASRELDLARRENAFAFQVRPDGGADFNRERSSLGYGLEVFKKLSWGTTLSTKASYQQLETDEGIKDEFTRASVEINQPLFKNAGGLVNLEPVRSARSSVLTARRAMENEKSEIVLRVVQAYESLLSAHRRIASDQRALARREKLFDLTQAREIQGRERRVDTLRVDLQRGEAQVQLENSLEQFAAEKEELADLLGYTQDIDVALTPAPMLALELPAFEEAVHTALSNRMDFAQILQNLQDAKRGIKISRRALWPELALRTRYEAEGGEDDSRLIELDEDEWFFGITIGSNLNQQDEKAAYQQAGLTLTQVRLDLEDHVFRVAREVKQQIRAYRRAQSAYRITQRNTQLAQQRLDLAASLFRMGRGDNFSVTDAEDALRLAEEKEFSARAEAAVSGYRLLRAMGTLTEHPESLKPGALAHVR